MKLCRNERCKRGPGRTRKQVVSEKPWAEYCCRECGDAFRRRKYYLGQKAKK
jgi:hypothetical protein